LTSPAASHFETDSLGVDYGPVFSLEVPALRISRGEAVAVVGPSGAGKTTLLGAFGAALRPHRGTVRVDGRALSELNSKELRRVRTEIGFIPQDFALVPNVRVIRNVLAGRLGRQSFARSIRSHLWTSKREALEVHEILERAGIGQKLYERTDTLSGGQLQRVAIARALYQSPGALLADEPVSSVDPARARDTLELLLELSRERGLTLVVSTHNIDLARELFPRLIGLRDGRIAFDGAASQISTTTIAELYRFEAGREVADGA
jgi:phosphonate transport system ATP-binding protein